MSKRKMKLDINERLWMVERYLNGDDSVAHLAMQVGIKETTFRNWLVLYQNEGPTGLLPKQKNNHYSAELKFTAVHDYLNDLGSLSEIAKKYRLRSQT